MPVRTPAKPSGPPAPDTVSGRIGAACVIVEGVAVTVLGLLVDGRLIATATARAGTARLALPPALLGREADVIDAATGQSILPAPLDLAAARPITWLGWALRNGRFAGRFRLPGPAGPVLVTAGDADGTWARSIALPGEDRIYAFEAALTHLPPRDAGRSMRPSVAGIPVPGAPVLAVTAASLKAAGHIDRVDVAGVHGWAVDLLAPKRRATVELRAGGRLLATVQAAVPRPDVAAPGWGDGRCGFTLPLPPELDRGRDHKLQVHMAGSGLQLTGSPVLVPALPPFAGYFDAVAGPMLSGWAIDMHRPDEPPLVEAVCDGEVIGTEQAGLYRFDVMEAGMPTPWCGVRLMLDRPLSGLYNRDISLRIKRTGTVLPGSPRRIEPNPNVLRLLGRSRAIPQPVLTRLIRRLSHESAAAPVSVLMPIHDTRRDWLYQAVNSVLNQWSAHWELICIDDASTAPHVAALLAEAERHDPRIRVLRAPVNGGVARTVNLGLRMARHPLVLVLDHDDALEPDAVHKLSAAASRTGADLLYADEAITGTDLDSIVRVVARPAFSYDYYLSHPYFVHPVCVRTELARRVGGWDETMTISADVDYVLRLLDAARTVAHVPAVLYRWRTHGGSSGHKQQHHVTQATVTALQNHLGRDGGGAVAAPGPYFNTYRVNWPDPGGPVLVVVPTKDGADLLRSCVDALERTCDGVDYRLVVIDHESTEPDATALLKRIARRHTVMPFRGSFNYARMNNLAVRRHGAAAEYVLFLNNDVDAREPGWLPRLRSLCGRPGIGAVAPLLLYDDQRVQHAGVVIDFNGCADHVHKFVPAFTGNDGERAIGYNATLTSVRDFSAVTAACMLVRKPALDEVGGFDERFAVAFNDTDLCLRLRRAGHRVLYDGLTTLTHHESATRAVRDALVHPEDNARMHEVWAELFRAGDPFYSPLLARSGLDHELRSDPGCKGRSRPRLVHLRGA